MSGFPDGILGESLPFPGVHTAMRLKHLSHLNQSSLGFMLFISKYNSN